MTSAFPRYNPASSVVETTVGDETILLDLDQGLYHGLDETGTFIWERLKQGLTTAEIADRLTAEYDVPYEPALKDISELIENLLERALVVEAETRPE